MAERQAQFEVVLAGEHGVAQLYPEQCRRYETDL